MNYLKPCPKPERKQKEKTLNPRVKVALESNPLECVDQETVANWLDLYKVLYSASVAGVYLHPATFNRVKKIGYKRGLPDILIFQKPPAYGDRYVGVAIELKRRKGGIVSDEQKAWLDNLNKNGWLVGVMRGADQAIEFLEICGYDGKKPSPTPE